MTEDEAEAALKGLSFEAALAELETIVDRLDGGDVELEQSILLYTRGAKLKAHCEAKLLEAEEKVQAITLDAEGNPKGLQGFEAT